MRLEDFTEIFQTSYLKTFPQRNFVMYLLYSSLESFAVGHNTVEAFYAMLIWSFEALWTGEEPVVDWKGKPIEGAVAGVKLMNGKFMAVWSLICDLEHANKCYQLPSPSGNCPCGLCPVNSGTLPWWDFRPNALWFDRVYTIPSWLASGWKKSKIFDIIGVSILSFYPDWMHCKSLGIDKPLIGISYTGSNLQLFWYFLNL